MPKRSFDGRLWGCVAAILVLVLMLLWPGHGRPSRSGILRDIYDHLGPDAFRLAVRCLALALLALVGWLLHVHLRENRRVDARLARDAMLEPTKIIRKPDGT